MPLTKQTQFKRNTDYNVTQERGYFDKRKFYWYKSNKFGKQKKKMAIYPHFDDLDLELEIFPDLRTNKTIKIAIFFYEILKDGQFFSATLMNTRNDRFKNVYT